MEDDTVLYKLCDNNQNYTDMNDILKIQTSDLKLTLVVKSGNPYGGFRAVYDVTDPAKEGKSD